MSVSDEQPGVQSLRERAAAMLAEKRRHEAEQRHREDQQFQERMRDAIVKGLADLEIPFADMPAHIPTRRESLVAIDGLLFGIPEIQHVSNWDLYLYQNCAECQILSPVLNLGRVNNVGKTPLIRLAEYLEESHFRLCTNCKLARQEDAS